MSIPSNGITPEVIRGVMAPYHLSLDLLHATFAALPAPPPNATPAWRRARVTRLAAEIVAPMPANADQARISAELLIFRELANTFVIAAQAPGRTDEQMSRLGRTASGLMRTAIELRNSLVRLQQKPAPFFGTLDDHEVDLAEVDAMWGHRPGQPADAPPAPPPPQQPRDATPPPAQPDPTPPIPDPQPAPPPQHHAQPAQSPDPTSHPAIPGTPGTPAHARRRRRLDDRAARPRPRLHPRGPAPSHPRRPGTGARGMSATVPTPKPPAAPDLPADPPPPATPGPLRNGNPRGNPNLAPRCGAKNRAGHPCCAPAMPNGRCHLHGGKCTGPRTPEGKAAFKAAHTKHGRTTAPKRAANLYARTLTVRSRLTQEAHRLSAHLPPDMAARLAKGPEELWPPVHLTNQPYVTNPESAWRSAKSLLTAARPGTAPRARATPTPHGLAAERLAARAEKAAMAPWRQAIAAARATKRAIRAAKREAKREAKAARQQARVARTAAHPTQPASRAPAEVRPTRTAPPIPIMPCIGNGLLQRELAARAAGLRNQTNRPPPGAPTPRPTAQFKQSRIDPLNREPATKSATAPFNPFRIDPLNREPTAKPGSTAPFKPTRIDPLNREQPAQAPLTSLAPTNDQAQPAPLNRAARRRLKYLQHRRAHAARPHR